MNSSFCGIIRWFWLRGGWTIWFRKWIKYIIKFGHLIIYNQSIKIEFTTSDRSLSLVAVWVINFHELMITSLRHNHLVVIECRVCNLMCCFQKNSRQNHAGGWIYPSPEFKLCWILQKMCEYFQSRYVRGFDIYSDGANAGHHEVLTGKKIPG